MSLVAVQTLTAEAPVFHFRDNSCRRVSVTAAALVGMLVVALAELSTTTAQTVQAQNNEIWAEIVARNNEIRAEIVGDSWLAFLQRAWRWSRNLNTEVDRYNYRFPMRLKEALGILYEEFDRKGVELPILLDRAALAKRFDSETAAYECEIDLTALPKGATLSTVLTEILRQLPLRDGTVVVHRTYLEITTVEAAAGRDRSYYALSRAAPIAEIWLCVAAICALAYACLRMPAVVRRTERRWRGVAMVAALSCLVFVFWPIWLIILGIGALGRHAS